MRTLKLGTKGEDVRYLQYKMKDGYKINVAIDGSFGQATKEAVKQMQRLVGFTGNDVDGSVGPATQGRIGLTDFIVHIYNKEDVWFAGTIFNNQRAEPYPVRTLKQWADLTGADRVYNLSLFNMVSKNNKGQTHDAYGVIKGRTINYLKAQGVECGYGGTTDKLTVDNQNICAGQFVGIRDGKALNVSGGARAINANGQLKDGRYFQVQSFTKVTPKQLISYMMSNYQVELMLIQDYGGSTGFYDRRYDCLIAAEKEGTNGRAVASVVCVRIPKEIITIKICPCCGQEVK